MRRLHMAILVLMLTWAMSVGAAAPEQADDGGASVLTRAPRGSLAAQLRLRLRLQMASGESLAGALDHNRPEWRALTPEQREQFRGAVRAFHQKDPKAQEQLLKTYNAFLSLDKRKRELYRRRARWLKVVVATFTPAERERLRRMSSMDRARALIARRNELVHQGKLKLDDSVVSVPAKSLDRPSK